MFQRRKEPGTNGRRRELPLERYWLVSRAADPRRAILIRAGIAVGIIFFVGFITWLDRDGYIDANNPGYTFNFLDSLYYATVTVTTTGYGDLVPSSQLARFISVVVVTPLRVLFLVLLVGTTLEALTTQSRKRARVKSMVKNLYGHTIICGFGVKGRSALEYMRKHNRGSNVLVIDDNREVLDRARMKEEVDGIEGKAFDREILRAAGIEHADRLIISLNTDEHAVLTVLRARELNPDIQIVSTCRKEENQELLKQSGADEVIVSASSAGRILGMAADAPDAAMVVNDLLTFGDGLDIDDRIVEEDGEKIARPGLTPIAVVRNVDPDGAARVLRPGIDEQAQPLKKGDRVVFIARRKDNEIEIPVEHPEENGPVPVASAIDETMDDLGE